MNWKLALLLLTALAAFAMVIVGWLQPGPTVDVVEVRSGTILASVSDRGETRLPEVTRITMPLAGRILPIGIQEGERVERDQIVARMETDDLRTDVLAAEAEAGQYRQLLKSLEKTLESARKQVEASTALAEYTSGELARLRTLAEKQAASPSEVAEMRYRTIDAKVETQTDELTAASIAAIQEAIVLGLQNSQETLRQKERDLARAEIRTPTAGVVLERFVNSEQYLPAGEPLLTIGDLGELEVRVDLLTSEAALVRPGDRAFLSDPAFGSEPVFGTVTRIEPEAFTKTSSLGVEQQRVPVIIEFDAELPNRADGEPRTIGVGYRVRATIIYDRRAGVPVIPRTCLFKDGTGRWSVFVVEESRLSRRPVRIGLTNDREAEILEGLQPGERVVAAPERSLRSGQQVEPVAVPVDEENQLLERATP